MAVHPVGATHELLSEVRGRISLQNLDRINAFTDADVQLLADARRRPRRRPRAPGSLTRRAPPRGDRRACSRAGDHQQRSANLAANLDIQSMYDLVGDKIQEIFDAQAVLITLFDVPMSTMQFRYAVERGVRLEETRSSPSARSPSTSSKPANRPVVSEGFRGWLEGAVWTLRLPASRRNRSSSPRSSCRLVTRSEVPFRSRTWTASMPSPTRTCAFSRPLAGGLSVALEERPALRRDAAARGDRSQGGRAGHRPWRPACARGGARCPCHV